MKHMCETYAREAPLPDAPQSVLNCSNAYAPVVHRMDGYGRMPGEEEEEEEEEESDDSQDAFDGI